MSDGRTAHSQIMISNSQRVGMTTFPHELPGGALKIGALEVWRVLSRQWRSGRREKGRVLRGRALAS